MTGLRACMIAVTLFELTIAFVARGAKMPDGASLASQGVNFTVEGKITHLSPGKLTLSTEQNIIFHVRYDEKTEIKRKDGGAASAKDFRAGMKVMVEGDLTETGEVVAVKIEIEQESAPQKH